MHVTPTSGLEYWKVERMIGQLGSFIIGQGVVQIVESGEIGCKQGGKRGLGTWGLGGFPSFVAR